MNNLGDIEDIEIAVTPFGRYLRLMNRQLPFFDLKREDWVYFDDDCVFISYADDMVEVYAQRAAKYKLTLRYCSQNWPRLEDPHWRTLNRIRS